MSSNNAIYQNTIKAGGMWSKVIGRGKTLRITDTHGGANVGMLLYNAYEKTERYNMPDTLKGQHIFYLSSPYCLHSDMGRLFATISQDSAGWHDTVCGCSDAASVLQQYGSKNFQEARNKFHRNARECFLIELAKWGLGKKDLVPNINWFSKVTADEEGQLHFDPSTAQAGHSIELHFQLDTLVVLNTCPHPLDPATQWQPKPIDLSVFPATDTPADHPCLLSRPENKRAWINTQDYNQLRF